MRIRCLLALALGTSLGAEVILTNVTILKLVQARISDDSIIAMVNQQPGVYSLAADDIVALKNAGVSEKVIAAMAARNGAGANPTASPAGALAVQAAPSTPFSLHDGTPIKLRLNQNLSSGHVKAGDTVEFQVLDDLRLDDVMVIARGSVAIGTIVASRHRRGVPRSNLDVNIDCVPLVNGDKVPLRAGLLMHGKHVTVPAGTEITAYVNGEINLDLAEFLAGTPAANAQPRAAK